MTDINQQQLINNLWGVADKLRGAMHAVEFCGYMLPLLLFLLASSRTCHHGVAR